MAVVTVYDPNGDVYEVDNGLNKKCIRITGGAGGNDKAYKLASLNLNLGEMTYDAIFELKDVSPGDLYEGPPLGRLGVSGPIDVTWISPPNLDARKLKMDAVNKLFTSRFLLENEPIDLIDYSVITEYATAL